MPWTSVEVSICTEAYSEIKAILKIAATHKDVGDKKEEKHCDG